MTELTDWTTFYVIVGSSAGALIGLQFVVLTLVAERPHANMAEAGAAFATPSVIHFAVVLMLAALVSVPWRTMSGPAISWGLIGLCGMGYSVIVYRRMKKQTAYVPVFEDWLFHMLLPFAAYTMLTIVSFVALSRARTALFFVGGATLLLLFTGIHNSWDAITYQVLKRQSEERKSKKKR